MPDTVSANAFADIFKNSTPLLDVRSPIEFQRGAFQHATNLPLLTDAEREAVGTQYRRQGRAAAIDLGNTLLNSEAKQQRLLSWQCYLEKQPSALLYCFRGGLRSQTVQQWLSQQGIYVPHIEGGYKALRRFLINTLDSTSVAAEFLIIAGKTGSGKTHLLNGLANSIDLEGIANHRGSAFGRRARPQPSQIDFENNLAAAFLKLPAAAKSKIFIEDEGRGIGSVAIPPSLYAQMMAAPIAVVEEAVDSRVETILNDYILSNYLEFKQDAAEDFLAVFKKFLLSSLERIQKRLGSKNYQSIRALMQEALTNHDHDTELQAHKLWIKSLLQNYYDPMYSYQLDQKLERVVFRGDKQEFLSWCAHINNAAEN